MELIKTIVVDRTTKDGTAWYLVKWRDLPYDQATWETEEEGVVDLAQAIEDYYNLRYVMLGVPDKKPVKKTTTKSSKKVTALITNHIEA